MNKLRLLLVENDEDEKVFMQHGFEASGFFEIVGIAENGDEFVQLMNGYNGTYPDVILTDLHMYGKDGYDILNYIKTNLLFAHIPVIITSGSCTEMVTRKCQELGAYLLLPKPRSFKEYKMFAEQIYRKLKQIIGD